MRDGFGILERGTYPWRLMNMPPERRTTGTLAASIGAIVGISVLAGLLVGLMLIPFAGSLGVLTRDVVRDFESLPDELNTPPLPERSVILASDGSVLATIYYQNRIEVPLESIAPIMRQAMVAVEDARFLDHNGVDFRGIVRAAASNASSGEISEGASTLTMQYVKNVLVNQATSAEELDAARGDSSARKIKELGWHWPWRNDLPKARSSPAISTLPTSDPVPMESKQLHGATFHSQQPTSPSGKPPPSLELFSGRPPTIQFAIQSSLQSAAMLS